MTVNSLVTITGNCPDCGHALKLCQAKAGALYIGCAAYPRCSFKCPYDQVLQALRDRNARLEAELTLLQMQQPSPIAEERARALPTWTRRAQTYAPSERALNALRKRVEGRRL
jgi:ssDNA-binding Zn-finger/Zn-ribbon topoisomerase 1